VVAVKRPASNNAPLPSRFASWDRASLEKLAEELTAELIETKGELAIALKFWRNEVKKNGEKQT
jgi:RNA-binding protein YhbY